MARHLRVTETLGATVYFCDSHSPWQRGSNENTNGLLRDYFPKGTDLSVHSADHLLQVENELNNRSRCVLGGRSPAELFDTLAEGHVANLFPRFVGGQGCDQRISDSWFVGRRDSSRIAPQLFIAAERVFHARWRLTAATVTKGPDRHGALRYAPRFGCA
jgi:hypothetical protein